MVGGIIRWFFDKMKNEEQKKVSVNNGILFCSGMIAGEGIVGLLLAILAVFGVGEVIDLSGALNLPAAVSNIGSLVLFAVIIFTLVYSTVAKKRKNG